MAKEMAEDLGLAIAKQIRRMRLANKWSREELAERASVNIYTLKYFERSGQISLERLLRLCQCLGLLDEMIRVFKPRARVDVKVWAMPTTELRQRGRRSKTVLVEEEVR